uniref:Uncharacterized protein n=1 Tax=Vitrella brassicaformis TaxID=1169539 RepID=A0A7S1JSE4_9ALVE
MKEKVCVCVSVVWGGVRGAQDVITQKTHYTAPLLSLHACPAGWLDGWMDGLSCHPHTDTPPPALCCTLSPRNRTTAPFMGSFSASFSPSCAQGRGGTSRVVTRSQ